MAAWCVLLALSDFDGDWIYDLSKWGLCVGCSYIAHQFWKEGVRKLLIPMGILAIVFNPIAPIHFDSDEWQVVDWIAAGALLLYVKEIRAFCHKTPVFLWAQFTKAPDDGQDFWDYFLGRFLIVIGLIFGIVVGYGVWEESTPEGQRKASIARERLGERKASEEAEKKSRWEREMLSEQEKKPEKQKYPRALYGGGLDWSGVESDKVHK